MVIPQCCGDELALTEFVKTNHDKMVPFEQNKKLSGLLAIKRAGKKERMFIVVHKSLASVFTFTIRILHIKQILYMNS